MHSSSFGLKRGSNLRWGLGLRAMLALLTLLALAACSESPSDPLAAPMHLKKAQWVALTHESLAPTATKIEPTPTGKPITAGDSLVGEGALPQTGWQEVALPHRILRTVIPTSSSRKSELIATDWYRLDLSAVTPSAEPLFLYIPRWKTNGQLTVYADGALIYHSEGSWGNNGYNHPLWLRLSVPNGSTTNTAPTSLALRIDRASTIGNALSTVWIGSADQLAWRYQVRYVLQVQLPMTTGVVFLTLGAFALLTWFQRRAERIYLIFSATCTAAFFRLLHYHTGGSELPISEDWFSWLTVASLMWLILCMHLLLKQLHQQSDYWVTRALVGVTLATNIATMPKLWAGLPGILSITPLLYLVLLILAIYVSFGAFRNGLRTPTTESWMIGGWFFFGVLSSIYDLALQNNRVSPEGLYTNGYIIMGLLAIFSYIMIKRYLGAISEVEQANANLAQRLQTREAELAASYERLRRVEHDQTLSQERQRMMQDMHDGLGSSLTSAIRSVEHGAMTEAEMTQVLKDCMDDLKLAIDSMEPIEADLLLLLATLRFRLMSRVKNAGVSLVWEVQEVPALTWLDPSAALHVLRIVQEAFANILKHTQATEISVRTGVADDGVTVTIADNGPGFDVDTALQIGGKGLHNQLRRAQFLGGRVSWQSGAQSGGHGASMTLWLPLKRVKS